MTWKVRRLSENEIHLFDRIAPDVFDEDVKPDRLRRYLQCSVNRMLLALEDDGDASGAPLVVGQCAAVIHHHPDKVSELYIDELGTASTHRRRGIGRLLMEEMMAWGEELGCEEGWLGTECDNVPARALYDDLFDPAETFVLYEFDLPDED